MISGPFSGNAIYRYRVEPRVKLYVPREASFPVPLKYIDVTRATSTSLDVMLEKISTIIGTLMEIENCQICGQVSQGSRYWMKKAPDEFSWSGGETDEKTNDLQTRHFVARDVERYVWCIEAKRKAQVGHRKTEARQCSKIAWYLLHWSWRRGCSQKVGNSDASSNALWNLVVPK